MKTNKGKILRLKPQNDRVVKRDSSAKAFRMTKESGRSMVEMLGVLAVVGVLSIGGIMGYTYAMKKHRVNELLNEGNLRAVLYTAQVNIGNISEKLSDLPDSAQLSGGRMSNEIVSFEESGEFGVRVDGVEKDVCEMLLDFVGEKDKDTHSLSDIGDAGGAHLSECSETNDLMMIYTSGMSGDENYADDRSGDCAEGHYGERCEQQCESPKIVNAAGDGCECDGSKHYVADGSGCKCEEGYEEKDGECVAMIKYRLGAKGNHTTLEGMTDGGCPSGYHWITKAEMPGTSSERKALFTDSALCDGCSGNSYLWLKDCYSGGVVACDTEAGNSATSAYNLAFNGLMTNSNKSSSTFALCVLGE